MPTRRTITFSDHQYDTIMREAKHNKRTFPKQLEWILDEYCHQSSTTTPHQISAPVAAQRYQEWAAQPQTDTDLEHEEYDDGGALEDLIDGSGPNIRWTKTDNKPIPRGSLYMFEEDKVVANMWVDGKLAATRVPTFQDVREYDGE